MSEKNHKIECDGGPDLAGPSIVQLLYEANILRIENLKDDRVLLTEMCDRHYSARLTREQMKAFIEELCKLVFNAPVTIHLGPTHDDLQG